MAAIVQSKPQVVNTMKRVKEEIVRFNSPVTTLDAGDDVEMQLYEGAGADYYTVRIGEGVELLTLGIESKFHQPSPADGTAGWIDRLSVQDWNSAEWNAFFVTPEQRTFGNTNELPFNNAFNFERKMMSWGYKSFLTSSTDVAPTLKLPEGDRLRLFARASTDGTVDIDFTADEVRLPASAIVRRYLPGSDIDYKHFDQYDGGIKSTKRYYNDYQMLDTTNSGQYTDAWTLTIIRNEAYKFFQAGVVGTGMTWDTDHWVTSGRTQTEAKIIIDDPLTEYNKYFIAPDFNHLPFTDTYSIYQPIVAGADAFGYIEKTHRFAPTIDVVKNRNKDLKLKVKDDGEDAATKLVTRFYGIRYIL